MSFLLHLLKGVHSEGEYVARLCSILQQFLPTLSLSYEMTLVKPATAAGGSTRSLSSTLNKGLAYLWISCCSSFFSPSAVSLGVWADTLLNSNKKFTKACVLTTFYIWQGEHVRQLEGRMENLQTSAEALAAREETTRAGSDGMAQRLRAAESALHDAQVELDALR